MLPQTGGIRGRSGILFWNPWRPGPFGAGMALTLFAKARQCRHELINTLNPCILFYEGAYGFCNASS